MTKQASKNTNLNTSIKALFVIFIIIVVIAILGN